MRLWHHDLIKFLPRTQLLAQWRELNSIFAKQDNHVLINYIYEYEKSELYAYTLMIINEFYKRGYNIRSFEKMDSYFSDFDQVKYGVIKNPFAKHHNKSYLQICYYNLKEKYIRGQKDFSEQQFFYLRNYYKNADWSK